MSHTNPPEPCTCLAIRQAARHVTQFYDKCLAPAGMRSTQFSILRKLEVKSPQTVSRLADMMVMDRTTLARSIQPLLRDGLIASERGADDGRSKALRLTDLGVERLGVAMIYWDEAQATFEEAFGSAEVVDLRTLMRTVTATKL